MTPTAYHNADESTLAFKPTRGGNWSPLYTEENMSIESIELWHKRARPNPADADFQIQLAVHLEELAEMFEVLTVQEGREDASFPLWRQLKVLSDGLKAGEMHATINPGEREAFLDALADQIVTAVGVGHCAGMQTAEAVARVNTSNWTKTVDGEFQRDAQGKITKPATYVKPNLEGLY
jgi:hypothetical protein